MKKIAKKILSCRRWIVVGTVVAGLGFFAAKAGATGFLYQFGTTISGTSPAGGGPWLNATFQDTTGGVLLTMNTAGMTSGEYLSGVYFNLNPADNVNKLTFTYENGTSSGVTAPTIHTGAGAFEAADDGKYDILFNFATGNSGRFGSGDTVTYLISGIAGLTAADFEYLAEPDGGGGPFYGAAHVDGIGTSDANGWIGPCLIVPEPGTWSVLALAAGLLGAAHLWRRRKTA
jgi:hypothetical protein